MASVLYMFAQIASASTALPCSARIAIAVPKTKDAVSADALAELVGKELPKYTPLACSRRNIVPQDESRRVFDVFGMTPSFAVRSGHLYTSQVDFLAKELLVTHVAFVLVDKPRDTVTVVLNEILDDDQLLEIVTFQMPYANTMESLPRSLPWVNLLSPLSANTVTFGGVETRLGIDLDEAYTENSTNISGTLPPLISSVSFGRIEHFRSYRDFDYSGSIFPSTFLFGINQDTEIRRRDARPLDRSSFRTLHVEAYGGCVTALAEGAVHTPLGTTYAGIGFGPCVLQKRFEQGKPVLFGTTAVRYELGHRAFFTESFYLSVNFDMLVFHGKPIYQSDVASTNKVERSGIMLGYYVADSEYLFSNFWR